jgi:hypothetical protein
LTSSKTQTIVTFTVQSLCLWPPNHKYVVFYNLYAYFLPPGLDLATTGIRVTGCTFDDDGSRDSSHDCVFSQNGLILSVRATRPGGNQMGRIYVVSFEITDLQTESATYTRRGPSTIQHQLYVPHDMSAGNKCIRPTERDYPDFDEAALLAPPTVTPSSSSATDVLPVILGTLGFVFVVGIIFAYLFWRRKSRRTRRLSSYAGISRSTMPADFDVSYADSQAEFVIGTDGYAGRRLSINGDRRGSMELSGGNIGPEPPSGGIVGPEPPSPPVNLSVNTEFKESPRRANLPGPRNSPILSSLPPKRKYSIRKNQRGGRSVLSLPHNEPDDGVDSI